MKTKKHIDIDQLINLSSFEVSPEEKKHFEKEIEDFLGYAEVINNAPCDDLVPSSHALEQKALSRNDKNVKWENLKSLLGNGPVIEGTSYLVPPQKGRAGSEEQGQEKNSQGTDTADFEAVIGLEVHAHLKTGSKLFCACSTEFGKDPNENTCPVCSGQPGVLPVLNMEAVKMAIRAGLAMNCRINKRSVFDRKNYFYPDLPKGYQISQFEEPICSGGYVEIEDNGGVKQVQLNRIHMEEDAGKLVHVGAPGIWGSKASAVDFNRSSVPLVEIVTEPDLNTAKQAKDYVIMLRAMLVGMGICDGNLEEGSLRCDANISIRKKGDKKLGVKTEVKNMNSFKAIEKAIDFEILRQKDLVKKGQPISQETRLWDEASQKTYSMRSKEESHDYRYFPCPDLLPLILEDSLIEELKNTIPLSPLKKKKKFESDYKLPEEQALLLMNNPGYAAFFEKVLEQYNNSKNAANWFFNELLSYTDDFTNIHITAGDFADFLRRIDSNEISGKIGKKVVKLSFDERSLLNDIIKEHGFKQVSDPAEIEKIVDEVLAANPAQVEEYKAGKTKVIGFLVGQIMKQSKGKANPALVNQFLKKKLG